MASWSPGDDLPEPACPELPEPCDELFLQFGSQACSLEELGPDYVTLDGDTTVIECFSEALAAGVPAHLVASVSLSGGYCLEQQEIWIFGDGNAVVDQYNQEDLSGHGERRAHRLRDADELAACGSLADPAEGVRCVLRWWTGACLNWEQGDCP